jgi:hypothetical protein
VHSWNQLEGLKIKLGEAKSKILIFSAPNRPTDTKHVFELKVTQKKSNKENIDCGKDIINYSSYRYQ